MPDEAQCQEYLEELHKIVCGHCLERLHGQLSTGVEVHLPRLIDALRRISKGASSHGLSCVCQTFDPACPGRVGQSGLCPMETLMALFVAASAAVNQRHQEKHEEEWERLLAVRDD